jgi:Family of unknown function (DUF6510)
MTEDDLTLDGNAIAGPLRDVFSFDITMARATCRECGATDHVGTLPAYVHAPGLVLRCPHCDMVQMRLVHAEGRYWLDLTGMESLEFTADPEVSAPTSAIR